MKTSINTLAEILWDFVVEYSQEHQKSHGHLPITLLDEQWKSPCQMEMHNEESVLWQPIKVESELKFDNVESALEISLHEDIKNYFTCLFSDNVHAKSADGHLSLLLPWSLDDFKRLQENIIGHILMKRDLKQEITVFFAVTDEDDLVLSIKNDSGEVWVERVGCEPHKKLADSITEYLKTITPYIYPLGDNG